MAKKRKAKEEKKVIPEETKEIVKNTKRKKLILPKVNKKKIIFGIVVLLLIIVIISQYNLRKNTIAIVNDERLLKEDYDIMYQRLIEKDPAVEKEVIMEQFIGNKLLAMDAEEKGIKVINEEIEELVRKAEKNYNSDINEILKTIDTKEEIFRKMLYEHLLITKNVDLIQESVTTSEEELMGYYTKYPEQFTIPAEAEISQIVLGTVEDGMKAHKRLLDGEDFAKVAEEMSIEKETGKSGGYAGFISPDKTSKKIANVIFQLKPGEFSEPVVILAGVYIFKVHNMVEEEKLTFEEVTGNLHNLILNEKRKIAVTQYAQKLYKDADIKLYEENI